MKKYTWIPAGLMLLGGAALAQAAVDPDPNNTAAGQVAVDVNASAHEGMADDFATGGAAQPPPP